VLVSQLVPMKYRLHALLHDAAEAYFGDMIYSLKYMACNREYRDAKSEMRAKINERFGLGLVQSQECQDVIRHADLIMLATERRDLMSPDNTPWLMLAGIEPRGAIIRPMMPNTAESAFLYRYKELTGSM
jgi:uncharacterized protein